MKRTFLRAHLMAWIAGVVFAYVTAAALVVASPFSLIFSDPWTVLKYGVPPSLIALLLMWRIAVIIRPYEFLIYLPGALGLALAFGSSYSRDIHLFLPDDGHTMFTILGGGARPFDFSGQAFIFLKMLVWMIAITWGGLVLARHLSFRGDDVEAPTSPGSQDSLRKIARWLAFDVTVIACVTIVCLRIQVVNRVAEGQPENILRTVTDVLDSKTANPEERLRALNKLSKMGMSRVPGTRDLLRRASREQPEPINLPAAAHLLGDQAGTALPNWGNTLMRTSLLSGASSSTSTGPLGGTQSQSGLSFQVDLRSTLMHVTDPSTAPILARLMQSQDAGTRLGSVAALSNMGTSTAIKGLITGLDDDDAEVRYFSLCGLTKNRGDTRFIDLQTFESNEAKYIDPWKAWAKLGLGKTP